MNDDTSSATVEYSLVQGWIGGTNNLPNDTDPVFQDPDNGNFQLSIYSPCINRGNNDYLPPGMATDLAGNPRIYDESTGGIVDMGAYEYQGLQTVIILIQPEDVSTSSGSDVVFTVTTAAGANCEYQWQYSSDGRTWINIPGAITNQLDLSQVEPSDNGKLYHVLVISDYGNVISNAGKLTVS